MSKASSSTDSVSRIPMYSRLGEVSLVQTKIHPTFARLIFMVWKFQMLAIPLKIAADYLESPTALLTEISKGLSNVFLFSDMFTFNEVSSITAGAFFITQTYTWLTIFYILFIIICLFMNKRISTKVQSLWGWICNFHVYLFNFPIMCFNFRLIEYADNGNLAIFFPNVNGTLRGLAIVSLIWTLLWAFVISGLYSIPVKTKDPFSSKSRDHSLLEFFNKVLLIVLIVFLDNGNSKYVTVTIINLVLCIIKLYQVFTTIPYYRAVYNKIEFFVTSISTVLACLNFLGAITLGHFEMFPQKFILIIWTVYVPITGVASLKYYQTIRDKIIINPHLKNKYYILSHVSEIKAKISHRIPLNDKQKAINYDLLSSIGQANNISIFNSKNGLKVNFDFDDNLHISNYIKIFLQYCLKQYPEFLPLKMAYFHNVIKYQKNFVLAANYIEDFYKTSKGITAEILTSVSRNELQQKMIRNADEIDEKSKVNIKRFEKINEHHTNLKAYISEQIQLQMKFWKEYLENDANFKSLYKYSQRIEKRKRKLKQYWSMIEAFNNKTSIASYIIWAAYLESINNLPTESLKLMKQSLGNKFKGSAINDLNNETIYINGTYQLNISGRKDSLGKIISCSPGLIHTLGYSSREVINNNLSCLLSNFYKEKHELIMRKNMQNYKQKCLGRSREVILKFSDNYLVAMMFHAQLSPYIETGISYIAILREYEEAKELLLIRNNGIVDGCTKYLAETLGIKPDSKINFEEICSEIKVLLAVCSRIATIYHLENSSSDFIIGEFSTTEKRSKSLSKDFKFALGPEETDRIDLITTPRDDQQTSRVFNSKNISLLEKSKNKSLKYTSANKIDLNESYAAAVIMEEEEVLRIYKEYTEDYASINFQSHAKVNLKGRARIEIDYIGDEWIMILKVKDVGRAEEAQIETINYINQNNNTHNNTLQLILHRDNNLTQTRNNMLSTVGLMETDRLTIHNMTQSAIQEVTDQDQESSKGYASILEENGKLNVEEYVFIENYAGDQDDSQEIKKLDIKVENKITSKNDLLPMVERKKTAGKSIPNLSDDEIESGSQDVNDDNAKKKIETKIQIRDKAIDRQSSIGTSNGSGRRNNKLFESAIEFKYRPFKYIFFFWLYILIIAGIEGLIVGVGVFINSSLSELRSKGNIVITAYKRTDSLNFVIVSSRFINQAVNGRVGNATTSSQLFPEFVSLLSEYLPKLDSSNKNLQTYVSTIEESLQYEFYRTKVLFYDVDLNGILPSNKTFDTFQAIYKIYSLADPVLADPYINTDARQIDINYLRQNSLGDILVGSEAAITLTINELRNVVDSYDQQLKVLAAVGLCIIGIMLIITLVYARELNIGVAKFSKYFIRMTVDEVHTSYYILEQFSDKMKNDFQDGGIILDFKRKSLNLTGNNRTSKKSVNTKSFRSASIYIANLISVIKLWPVLIALIISIVIIFSHSSSGVSSLRSLQDQLTSVAYNQYIFNLGACAVIDVVVRNATSILRSSNIMPQMDEIISLTKDSADFASAFTSSSGYIDSQAFGLLNGISCEDTSIFTSEAEKTTCAKLSGGRNKIGILEANVQLGNSIQDIIQAFFATPRQRSDMWPLLYRIWTETMSIDRVQNSLITKLADVTNNSYYSFLSSEQDYILRAVAISSVVIILLAIACISFPLIKLINKENSFKQMFKLVPIPIIMRNRMLKSYLSETSGKVGSSVTKVG